LPFAAGTLAGTAIFLILPGGLELISGGLRDEAASMRLWGGCILFGWLFSLVIEQCNPHTVKHDTLISDGNTDKAEADRGSLEVGDGEIHVPVKTNIAFTVLFGDAVHGVIDGIVIGFAAKACDSTLLWTIVLATTGHEFPQELSAFAILVKEAGMSWMAAAVWNFVAAQGALIGAVLGYYANVGDVTQGAILALSGGVFLYLAFSELLPQVLKTLDRKGGSRASVWIGFTLGVIVMAYFAGHAHCHPHEHGDGSHVVPGQDDHGHDH